MNADIASSFPLLGLYSAHSKKTGAICTMLSTTVDPEEATKYGCIVCDPQDEQKVVHFVEKPESFISNVISCGVYLFSSKIFPYLADALSNKRDKEKELGTPMSTMMHSNDDDDLIQFEKDVLPLLMPIKHLFTWTCDPGRDFWMQVKTGSSTISANRAYLQHYIQVSPGKLSLPKGENKKDEPKPTIIKPVFIHPSAIIHPTAKIGPNVSIGPRCMIGRGVRVRDSIILDNCEIKHDSCILNSVLGWDSKIGSWVRIEGAPFTDPLALTLKGYKLPSASKFILNNCRFSPCILTISYFWKRRKGARRSYHSKLHCFAA
jgi:mannose-1-phosphate guanylyltransferase